MHEIYGGSSATYPSNDSVKFTVMCQCRHVRSISEVIHGEQSARECSESGGAYLERNGKWSSSGVITLAGPFRSLNAIRSAEDSTPCDVS